MPFRSTICIPVTAVSSRLLYDQPNIIQLDCTALSANCIRPQVWPGFLCDGPDGQELTTDCVLWPCLSLFVKHTLKTILITLQCIQRNGDASKILRNINFLFNWLAWLLSFKRPLLSVDPLVCVCVCVCVCVSATLMINISETVSHRGSWPIGTL